MSPVVFWAKVIRFYSDAVRGEVQCECADWRPRGALGYGALVHVVTVSRQSKSPRAAVRRVFVRGTLEQAKRLVRRLSR